MFSLKFWRQDVQASVVVFLVALPLCLGIALASNAPLSAGLVSGIIGGMVIGSFSGSPVSVSGPAAGLTVIVIHAISELGSFDTFVLAVFLSGLIQIGFGFLRGGVIGNYFPSAVIKGMLAAIGIILILKQLPHAVGYDSEYMGDESFEQAGGRNTFTQILAALDKFHVGAIIISLSSLAIMLGWDKISSRGTKFTKMIPGALLAVLSSIILNELFKKISPQLVLGSSHLVQLPFSSMREFSQGLIFPDFAQLYNPKVYITAFTIALIGSLESLLSVDASDKITEEGLRTDKNRELLAQGLGNTISGLLGGLPITAVIVRSSANATAGARSNLAAVLHGLWLFVCVISIPNLLSLIPLSSLAAVLLLVGYKLTKPSLFKQKLAKGWNQFIPFTVTIVAILFTDLLVGITIGMVVGFFYVIRASIHQSVALVSEGNSYLVRFYKDVSFLQKTTLMHKLDQIPENSYVIIDGSDGVFIDEDIVELIEDYCKKAKTMNIQVELKRSSTALSPMFKEVARG